MKVQVKKAVFKENSLVLCCDVGKTLITAFGEIELNGQTIELFDDIQNNSVEIRMKLEEFQKLAREDYGLDHVHVICEPTGGCEKRLMAIAYEMGVSTSYVSGEATSKFRVVTSNDPEKSDEKDPRIINAVRKSVTLVHRILPENYEAMRLLLAFLEDENQRIVNTRNQLCSVLMQLWPDFSKKVDFLYGNAGNVLFDTYSCNPYLMLANGWSRFHRELREKTRIHEKTIKQLWADVNKSAAHIPGEMQTGILADRMKELWEEWKRLIKRKENYKEQLTDLYKECDEYKKLTEIEGVSDYQMSKLIAETGPLKDFGSVSQLMRYAGLNICRRSSGRYVGQSRISKKGRSFLRKGLYQITFSSLIIRNGIYREYYKTKKNDLKHGKKAMVCVMRKFLKMTLGVYRSAIPFNRLRVQLSQKEFEGKETAA